MSRSAGRVEWGRGAAGRSGRLLVGAGLAAGSWSWAAAGAQEPAAPPVASSVAGRVVRPGASEPLPVAAAWVTLHRVGRDSSGPVDSVRTDGGGRYALRYAARADEAVYFASTMYGGVAYFTAPLRPGAVSGDEAEITVFDTTSAGVGIGVRGRHLVVSGGSADGRRTVVEVYELSNDSTATLVPGARRRATWSAPLPPNAAQFEVNQGDIARDAVTFGDGRVQVFAPIAPGIRQLAFSYSVPEATFPWRVAVGEPVTVLEVLLEDPGGRADGAGLAEQAPVSIEGRSFRRFLAQDAPAGSIATVTVAGAPPRRITAAHLAAPAAIAAVIMLAALGLALGRRAHARAADTVLPATADRFARDIADLDDAFARAATPSEEEKATYVRRREALKRRLSAALAREGATT